MPCAGESVLGPHDNNMQGFKACLVGLSSLYPSFSTGSWTNLCVCRAGMSGYILKATLSSTMGRAVPITLPSLQQAVTAAAGKRHTSF